jgi:GNAT superfamily N-acetyltransferase
MRIRTATLDDAPALRLLIGQLGYPPDPEVLPRRLAAYLAADDLAVLVAEDAGRVVGVASGGAQRILAYDGSFELGILVVEENARGSGVGKALLAAFEDWARGNGAKSIRLGSRDWRVDAHRFYEREGYHLDKIHHIMRKDFA